MAFGYLITYEYKGKRGNDFSKEEPFKWLIKYKEKMPELVLEQSIGVNVPLFNLDHIDKLINIENDYPEIFKVKEPEVVVIPEPEPEPEPVVVAKEDDTIEAIQEEFTNFLNDVEQEPVVEEVKPKTRRRKPKK